VTDFRADPAREDPEARRRRLVRHATRVVASLALTRPAFTADDAAKSIQVPEGVNARNVGHAFTILREANLIRRASFQLTRRRDHHGHPHTVWEPAARSALERYLRDNPPDPEDPPAELQLNLPFD
jgi:hypothetical protein